MPKASAEPEKPVEPQPAPAAETKAEEPKTAPRNKKDKTAKKAAETAAAEHESVEEAREARIAAREQKMEERERRTAPVSYTHLLEVTESNVRASALYHMLGFEDLEYRQMILDTPPLG